MDDKKNLNPSIDKTFALVLKTDMDPVMFNSFGVLFHNLGLIPYLVSFATNAWVVINSTDTMKLGFGLWNYLLWRKRM